MNAHGVSVFYGADTIAGAIAEVRPSVASRVVTGRFDLLRPVRLLDLQALRSVAERGSLFDPAFADRLSRLPFLRSLRSRMSRPVMPTDEAFDYLATQAVIDFLANGLDVKLDGVLFSSAQSKEASINVVLFHRASRVQRVELPSGAELEASTYMSTEEGPEPWYTVYENVPSKEKLAALEAKKPKIPGLPSYMALGGHDETGLNEEVTLSIDLKSLKVHEVSSISYGTHAHNVSRHRME